MLEYPPELVRAATEGDRQAIGKLLAAAQPDIRRYARRSCRTTSDVEDAVQETLFVLYRRLDSLRSVASLSGRLFMVVHRARLTLAANVAGQVIDLDAVDRELGLQNRPTAEPRLDVADAIQSPPPDYRAIVLLRDVGELTVAEIAARLGLTREAVKGRLHRARGLLREYLV